MISCLSHHVFRFELYVLVIAPDPVSFTVRQMKGIFRIAAQKDDIRFAKRFVSLTARTLVVRQNSFSVLSFKHELPETSIPLPTLLNLFSTHYKTLPIGYEIKVVVVKLALHFSGKLC